MSTNIDFIRKKKNNHLFAIDRHNDIERATTSKSSLEHRQREEARIRKETGRNWETKVSCFCLVSVAIALTDGLVGLCIDSSSDWLVITGSTTGHWSSV